MSAELMSLPVLWHACCIWLKCVYLQWHPFLDEQFLFWTFFQTLVCSVMVVHILSSKRLLKNTSGSQDVDQSIKKHEADRNGPNEGPMSTGNLSNQFNSSAGIFTSPELFTTGIASKSWSLGSRSGNISWPSTVWYSSSELEAYTCTLGMSNSTSLLGEGYLQFHFHY